MLGSRVSPFTLALGSPLLRHPALLLRKAVARLGARRPKEATPCPATVHVRYPDALAPTLRRWVLACDVEPAECDPCRVFGTAFDRALLLRHCACGPERDRTDVRGDIKLAWDFSRAQAYPIQAAVSAPEARGPLAKAIAHELAEWSAAAGADDGVCWVCAMEIAIRAVNLIAADALLDGAIAASFGDRAWAELLWRHGILVWRRLEATRQPSNHYLSNILGLQWLGTVLEGHAEPRRWRRFAAAEMPAALRAQTFGDGGLNEASLPYHALVTEMALLWRLLADPVARRTNRRVRDMLQIVADASAPGRDVFPVGDDDAGRVFAPDHASRSLSRSDCLLALARELDMPTQRSLGARLYPRSGWWFLRSTPWHVAVEFGSSYRGHAHNDTLSLCVCAFGEPLLADPGSGIYTPDPALRNRLRGTAGHTTVMVDGLEQHALRSARPEDVFLLGGERRPARILDHTETGIRLLETSAATGAPLSHERAVDVGAESVDIVDRLSGEGEHTIAWRLVSAPGLRVDTVEGGFATTLPRSGRRIVLLFEAAALRLTVETAPFATGYARVVSSAHAVATWRGHAPMQLHWRIALRQ